MSTLKQATAKGLMTSPHGKDLAIYLGESILEMDCVSDIKSDNPQEVAVEVKARKVAVEKLQNILEGLLLGKDRPRENTGPSEYAM